MNWPLIPLGEVLQEVSRPEPIDPTATYRMLGVRLDSGGPFLRETIPGSAIAAKTVYRVETGDFIYSRLFAWRGPFGVISRDLGGCTVSNEFPTYRPRDNVLVEFIALWSRLSTTLREVEALCSGSTPLTRNRLREELFATLRLPLPPVEEQRRIVARVDAIASRVAEACRLREEVVAEFDVCSVTSLKHVVEELGRNYPVRAIGEITTVTAGGTPDRGNPAYWGGSIPWVKTGELCDGEIHRAEEGITEEGIRSSSAKLFPVGTILIALYGQGQTRGRTGRLCVPATTNQACCAILPSPDLEPQYLQFWLKSLYLKLRETSHGGAQPNWNGSIIKRIKIALPPLDEQQRIVAHLDALQAKLDAVRAEQAATAAELDALLPSVLNRAFAGGL